MTSDEDPDRTDRQRMLMTFSVTMSIVDRAYRAAANQSVAPFGMSQAMAWSMVTIGRYGDGMRQGMLAGLLGIEGPSVARSVEQLVDGGFVERREDPGDRRAKTLHLTQSGRVACAEIESVLDAMRCKLFAKVSNEDVAAALRVFGALQGSLGCAQPVVPPLPGEAGGRS